MNFLFKSNFSFHQTKIYFASIFCLIFAHLGATTDSTISFSSPREAVKNHLENLQNDNYQPKQASMSFRFYPKISQKSREFCAIQLKQIWDVQGIFININSIPDSNSCPSPYYLDSANKLIYLERVDKDWKYSLSSSQDISLLYSKEFPNKLKWFELLLPKRLARSIGGLYEWQWLGMLMVLGFALIIFFIVRMIARNSFVWLLQKWGFKATASLIVKPVSVPVSILISLLVAKVLIKSLHLPIGFSAVYKFIFAAFIPLLFVVIVYRLVSVLTMYLKRLSLETESKLDDQLVPMVDRFLKFFVLAIGLVFVLQNLGYSVTGLLAGLSIGGLALAFAAQDTLKHFFGSIMIFVDKPFQIGDWVSGNNIDGTVEEVGFRSTRIRTFRDSVQYVPNGTIADLIIDNHGERNYRRFNTSIGLTYDTSTEKIQHFVDDLKKIILDHPKTIKTNYQVHLNKFSASSLDILFYVFFKVDDWSEELAVRHEIMLEIIRKAEQLEVKFAFPSQSLYVEQMPLPKLKRD